MPEPFDLDARVVRSLMQLTGGRIDSFAEQTPPPESIVAWVEGARAPEARGLLCLALRRWHEIEGG